MLFPNKMRIIDSTADTARAKELYFLNYANYWNMRRNGEYEEYVGYSIPDTLEQEWSKTILDELVQKIQSGEEVRRVHDLAEVRTDESEILKRFQMLSTSKNSGEIIDEVIKAESLFPPHMFDKIVKTMMGDTRQGDSDRIRAEILLSDGLPELGFQKKGNRFLYLVKDDIIGMIVLERPGDTLYVRYAFMPLFLPCHGFIQYSYGMSLGSMYRDLPTVCKASSDEQAQVFCDLALSHIKQEILPFLHEHSTAASLNALAKSPFNKNRKYLFCDTGDRLCLRFFSNLCCKDYKDAIMTANKYAAFVRRARSYTEAVKEQRITPVGEVIAALDEGNYNAVEQILRTNREENLALYIEQ